MMQRITEKIYFLSMFFILFYFIVLKRTCSAVIPAIQRRFNFKIVVAPLIHPHLNQKPSHFSSHTLISAYIVSHCKDEVFLQIRGKQLFSHSLFLENLHPPQKPLPDNISLCLCFIKYLTPARNSRSHQHRFAAHLFS